MRLPRRRRPSPKLRKRRLLRKLGRKRKERRKNRGERLRPPRKRLPKRPGRRLKLFSGQRKLLLSRNVTVRRTGRRSLLSRPRQKLRSRRRKLKSRKRSLLTRKRQRSSKLKLRRPQLLPPLDLFPFQQVERWKCLARRTLMEL